MAETPQNFVIVHTHKCAGSSLRFALREALSAENVTEDYGTGMQNPDSLYNADRETYWRTVGQQAVSRVVMGHFNPLKYSHVPAAHRICLLRHPIDRMISHYYFWKKHPVVGNRLCSDLLNNDRDIIWFANQPIIKSLYTKGYFAGVDMEEVSLIVFYENLEADIRALSRLMNLDLRLLTINVTNFEGRPMDYWKQETLKDANVAKRLEEILEEDIVFYKKCRLQRSRA